jgi:ABC-type polysaccharide/polyol phosphate export permease
MDAQLQAEVGRARALPPISSLHATATGSRKASFTRSKDVLLSLVQAEMRERGDLTMTGLLQWIMEPLSFMFVYFALVTAVMGNNQANYMLILMAALLPWRYFSGTVARGLNVIEIHSQLIKNRVFPRILLPMVPLLAEGVNFLIGFVLFAPLMIYYGISPTVAFLWLPVVIALLVFLSAGPTYLTTVFGLYFPGVKGTARNFLRVVFFASTALVSIRGVANERVGELLLLNPLSGIFESFRAVIVYGRAPGLGDMLYPAAVGAVLLVCGVALYASRQDEFPKEA